MTAGAAARRIHPALVATAVAFALMIVAAGVRSAPTVFLVPLETEFGWSDATVSFAIAVNIALFGLMGPFAAALMERFGIRRTVLGALALLVGGALGSLAMRAPWMLVATWGVLIGIGTGCISLVLGATVVNRWFSTQRGTAMGVLSAANATGQLVFLPLFAQLVARGGWRTEAIAVALVCAALVPLVLVALREYPADLGVAPFGATAVVARPVAHANVLATSFSALGTGVRSRDFWLLAGTFAICGASTNGLIGTHLIPACGDHGIPPQTGAALLAAMGVFDVIGTTLSGWLSDRVDCRLLLCMYYGLRGAALLALPQAFGIAAVGLPVFAVFYGLDWVATVPATLRLVTAAFGRERAAVMFGWIAAGHQLGAAVAASGAGLLRTVTLSYDGAFLTSGALCLGAAVVVLLIGRGRAPRPISAPA